MSSPQNRRHAVIVGGGVVLALCAAFFLGRDSHSPDAVHEEIAEIDSPASSDSADAGPEYVPDSGPRVKIAKTELLDLGSLSDAGAPAAALFRLVVTEGEGGPGKPDVPVVVEELGFNGRPPIVWRTKTNRQGICEFILPYGAYNVSLDRPGMKEDLMPLMVEGPSVQKAIVIREPGMLHGRIVDGEGKPVPQATIRYQPVREGPGTVRTNASGEFELELGPGIYALDVEAAGFASVRRAGIQVTSTRRRQERFSLVAMDANLFVQSSCSGVFCEGAEVLVEWPGGTRITRADRQGIASLKDLPGAGVYVRVVWHRGQADEHRGEGSLSLKSRGRGSLSLDLSPTTAPATPDASTP